MYNACLCWEATSMKAVLVSLMVLWLAAPVGAQNPPSPPPRIDRQISITIGDLPAGAARRMSGPEIVDMTAKLVSTLRQQQVPAVGFVNERRLYYNFRETNDTLK